MTRSARATFLILAILWQALVWLTPLGQAQKVADLINTMAHAQAVVHHHHDDQALHMDDHALDAAQHQHASEVLQLLGLEPLVNGIAFDRPRTFRFSSNAAPVVTVFLQRPLRPPQLRAV